MKLTKWSVDIYDLMEVYDNIYKSKTDYINI